MRLHIFIAAMSALVCAACSTPSRTGSNVKDDYTFAGRRGAGLVIVSTRFSTDCDADKDAMLALHYMDDSNAQWETGVIPVKDWFSKPDLQDPPGYFVVRELRAGQYYLLIHGLSFGVASPVSKWKPTPFTVEEGKAVYLGEIRVTNTGCHPIPPGSTYQLQVTDQWERDSKHFQQRMKNLRPEDVTVRLLSSEPAQP